MPHLSAERLAALADAGELPREHESDHLTQCAECAAERAAYQALVLGAREERRTIATPVTNWSGIAAALRDEGMLQPSSARGRAGAWARHGWMRAAAAAMLLACGIAAGRMSAVAGPLAVGAPEAQVVVGDGRVAGGDVSQLTADELIPTYATVAEAEAALERYEVAYQHAAAYLAGSDTSDRLDATEDYRTRLAALDRAGRTMREAMEKAPYDPVLTGYYLTTLGQREATLRQLNVAVPPGARLNSF